MYLLIAIVVLLVFVLFGQFGGNERFIITGVHLYYLRITD